MKIWVEKQKSEEEKFWIVIELKEIRIYDKQIKPKKIRADWRAVFEGFNKVSYKNIR